MSLRTKRVWAVAGAAGVAVLLLAGAAIARTDRSSGPAEGAGTPAAGTDARAEMLPEVRAQELTLGDLVVSVRVSGSIVARRSVAVRAQASGTLELVHAEEGEEIAAGAPLAQLRAADLRLALRDAEVRQQQAALTFSELTLFDDRIPDASVRMERARNARLRSGLATAEVALERARADVEHSTIRSPFDGVVTKLLVQAGRTVAAGEDVAEVAAMDTLMLDARVLESDLGRIRIGTAASVAVGARPDSVLVGTVVRIRPSVDPETHSGSVVIALAHPPSWLRPGGFASASVEVERRPKRLLVPRSALLERDGRTLVFVVPGSARQARASWAYVDVLAANDSLSEVRPSDVDSAIRPGARVLVSGHSTLAHDARVQVIDAPRP